VLQGLFLVGSTVLVIWCKELFFFLSSNAELARSYPVAIIIIMSYTYRPMYWGTINRLGFEEKTEHLWKISLVGGLINVVLNLIFIPYWGIYGTAFSTFIGLMYIGFSGYYLKAFRTIERLNYYPLVWASSIVVVSLLVYFVRDAIWYSKLILTSFVLIGALLLAMKYRKELKRLNDAF
jgi:O-antigen/teichoic acid export membrane protein